MLSEQASLRVLKATVSTFPKTVMILGSGWNSVAQKMKVESKVDYKQLFGVSATVLGHSGELIVGTLVGKRIAIMSGRFHMFEGYTGVQATVPIRVFHKAGMKRMVVTSAVGAINEHYRVGEFVLLSDMITLFLSFDNPLSGPQFVDLSEAFDPTLRQVAREVLVKNKLDYQEGVYMYLHGPNFETPADKMTCKILGADVVGMSTVPETMMAKWLGVKVIGISYVTNLAFVKHDHGDVLAAAEAGGERMVTLLTGLVTAKVF
jgi:purine-nucleoside phosphorylase